MKKAPLTDLLSDLVAIPSMNPLGRNREGKEYSEQAIADFVSAFLRKAGVDLDVYEIAPGRPNVEGYVDAACEETLLLEAHLDTVHVGGMSIEPFEPVVNDGKVFGRGACDTKASIAAFLHAVVSSLARNKRLRCNVRFLFVSDEEYSFTGAREAVRRGLNATFGIAGEPTSLDIVRAHKGVTRWKIKCRGIAGHSAYPERGKNAIYEMAEVVKRLERYANDLAQSAKHPSLGSPTLSVGVIEGGQAVNVIPDACMIEVDRRSMPGETHVTIMEPIRKLLADLLTTEVAEPHIIAQGMEVPENAPIVRLLARAAESAGAKSKVTVAGYATDAGIYTNAGVPVVVFGPGDIAQAHTEAEYVSVRELEQASWIIERLITD